MPNPLTPQLKTRLLTIRLPQEPTLRIGQEKSKVATHHCTPRTKEKAKTPKQHRTPNCRIHFSHEKLPLLPQRSPGKRHN
jgi:hypothetical protein